MVRGRSPVDASFVFFLVMRPNFLRALVKYGASGGMHTKIVARQSWREQATNESAMLLGARQLDQASG